ncbi:glycoside hydrolase family 31 protein [Saccharata proteae CBS 121410]|uniref:Glycoside hydrolase family 31 protein n=1 Tax=Saccharata proteae CBS 121410 TaxID=1314787 RepID=A0A9P4LRI2_9PEZI|nr:glycoside hydrolase family 31 protein [Saccharata proteae CBS 121410]
MRIMIPLLASSPAAAVAVASAAVLGSNASHYYSLGEAFGVSVGHERAEVLVETSKREELWKSPSTRAFISASSGLTNQSDSSGNFEILSDAISSRCQNPTISRSSQSSSAVSIVGGFADETGSCKDWSWSLDFTIAEKGDGKILGFNASVSGQGVDNVYLAYESPSGEAFLGLGEQASLGDLRGYKIPVWAREGGVGRGEEPVTSYLNSDGALSGTFAGGSALTTYTAIASYVSSLGRFLVLEGTNYALFDLASRDPDFAFEDTAAKQVAGNTTDGNRSGSSGTVIEIMYEGDQISGYAGRSSEGILDAITSLTTITGRQPALPDWANDGAVLGVQGGQTKVERIVQEALNYSMPLVSVWLQDWCGTRLQTGNYNISLSRLWWNWEPDQSLYPTWADWVPHLLSTYSVRTMSYVNTFLANVSDKDTGYTTNFYDEAVASGRFVMNATANDSSPWTITSGPGIDAGLLDLSNATTVAWFKDLVKQQFYSVPIKGAMQDFGEYLSSDTSVSISSGLSSPRSFHNAYPGAWARLLREVVEELHLANDTIGFHRSANTFSAPYTNLFWVGDQNIDPTRADGMRAVISSAIHMGASGWAATHSDIGGYTNTLAPTFNITRSPALLGRWGEMGAFSGAVFRTHEGNIPSVNTQVYSNASTYGYHAYNARLFKSLKPYRKALLQTYQQKGWPLVRHPIVYSPNDTIARGVVDEVFWFGDALFVAPVYAVESKSLDVYLPRIGGGAVYKHLWTGRIYEGGRNVSVETPWGKPGVFVRWPLSEREEVLLEGLFEFVRRENGTVLRV